MPSWKKLVTSGSDASIPSVSPSGDFTIDAGGDIILDADGADILLKDGGTHFGSLKRVTSDLVIKSETQDKDILFKGNDNGSVITALQLDMSDNGKAIFSGVISGDGSELTNLPTQTGTITALNNQSANRLVTIGSTTTELDGEANLVFDGTNLGIGETSPDELIHIKSSTASEPVIKIENAGDVTNGGQLHFVMSTTGEGDNDIPGTIRFKGMNSANTETEFSTIYTRNIDVTDGTEDSEMHFRTMNAGTLGSTMMIKSGNVGIGTTSPDYTLDVAGNIGMDEYLYHNGDTDTYIEFMDDRIYMNAGGDAVLDYAEDATSTLKLATNGEADVTIGTNHLFVGGSQGSYDAKVGIGNTTPGVALDVTGDIHASTYISGSAFVAKQKPASMTGANNVNLSVSANHNITITGDVTLTPTNFSARLGQSGIITLIQDSTGGHSITLNSLFKTPRGDSIAFDTTADGISLMSYYVIDASNVAVNYLGPFS